MSDRRAVLYGLALAALSASQAVGQDGYRKPPKAVLDILDAPPPPAVSVSPTGEYLLLVHTDRYPPIADLAAPTLRLAGLRIDPRTNGPARSPRVTRLTLLSLSGGSKELELPAGKVGVPVWSPDGSRFAVEVATDKGIELWVGGVGAGKVVRVPGVVLNAAVGEPVQWMPDNQSLLVQLVPENRGAAPAVPAAPSGPVVQESEGKAAPVRTFQDLLQGPHDEALFAYHATAQLAVVKLADGKAAAVPVGEPGIVISADPSPDGKLLLVSRVTRPFSYLLPYTAFPRTVEVWDAASDGVVGTVAALPLQDKVPIEGVPTGRRAVRWVPTFPHTLLWVEALDGGDPRAKVPHRDAVYSETVGSGRGPNELLKLEHRFAGLDFFPTDNRMLVRDYDRDRKWARTFVAPTTALFGPEPRLLFERSTQDRYGDPGTPLLRTLASGHRVLRTTGDVGGDTIWLSGPGASPKGDRPFLDKFDVKTGKAVRVFHCDEGQYEDVVAVLNQAGTKLLIRRESPTDPPNYFYRDNSHEKQLTRNADPAPELRKTEKTMLRAKRPDGVGLTVTLHLPPGAKKGDKRPAVVYAYPVEFASAADAGQVTGSPLRFTAVSGYSHLFLLTQGYAVLEVSMPIVGPPAAANDTFVDQLVANARAAIDLVAESGAIDPDRVGVMGHSYGAFMTANLLAHSDLFRAGIGRSGAYNRTLTPFGFQNERRTFWEAPGVYGKMSPFFHADKINEPLLLIHGAADNNPGTFPVQSERLYQAVRGTGGTCRLVLLPHEAHGYEARESVEHVLFEQIAWFDKYVKNAKPRK
ncbi:MAG: ptpA 2 [Gemmataceae bacterium]|nr:ptpA 2 [Gemmataceae bacterium]